MGRLKVLQRISRYMAIKAYWEKRTGVLLPWPQELTCLNCDGLAHGCEFALDPYNTNGDCLASK